MNDGLPRFEVQQPHSVSCLSWRPCCMLRPSKNPLNPKAAVQTEDLVVGDETGTLYFYAVEWPMSWEVSRDTWPGSMSLVAKISLHSQQICGLAWSPEGRLLASGGNDNLCYLFEAVKILGQDQHEDPVDISDTFDKRMTTKGNMHSIVRHHQSITQVSMQGVAREVEANSHFWAWPTSPDSIRNLGPGCERQLWVHRAAVKAIAFCPWREGLVATGGGSNDRCIHFFHTSSGSALATIAVAAQVTSLIWSTTKREIAATFGYAQPEHPYRIAIFSWPECRQVAAIP